MAEITYIPMIYQGDDNGILVPGQTYNVQLVKGQMLPYCIIFQDSLREIEYENLQTIRNEWKFPQQ